MASPDINTEDFSAAVDFLSVQPNVNPERIGILGICGWGGIAIQAAINDPRIKATVASTMYDMTRVTANGYFDADNLKGEAQCHPQHTGRPAYGRLPQRQLSASRRSSRPPPDDAPQFVKDYHAYYKTPRGYHVRSGNSTDGWNTTSALPFMNFRFFQYASELDNAVMIVHGENAHSRYFGEDTFKLLHGDNKELLIVADATHCDLYDNLEKIPMNQIAAFFNTWMPASN